MDTPNSPSPSPSPHTQDEQPVEDVPIRPSSTLSTNTTNTTNTEAPSERTGGGMKFTKEEKGKGRAFSVVDHDHDQYGEGDGNGNGNGNGWEGEEEEERMKPSQNPSLLLPSDPNSQFQPHTNFLPPESHSTTTPGSLLPSGAQTPLAGAGSGAVTPKAMEVNRELGFELPGSVYVHQSSGGNGGTTAAAREGVENLKPSSKPLTPEWRLKTIVWPPRISIPSTSSTNTSLVKDGEGMENNEEREREKELMMRVGREVRIVTQNENGPCSLIALANILILRGDIQIHPPDRPSVSYEYLSSLVAEFLLTTDTINNPNSFDSNGSGNGNGNLETPAQPPPVASSSKLTDDTLRNQDLLSTNFEHLNLDQQASNFDDYGNPIGRNNNNNQFNPPILDFNSALEILPKTQFGLDVNVRFGSVDGFRPSEDRGGGGGMMKRGGVEEPNGAVGANRGSGDADGSGDGGNGTGRRGGGGASSAGGGGELALFALSKIPLVHGWVCDPDDEETWDAVVVRSGDYDRAVERLAEGDNISKGLVVSGDDVDEAEIEAAVEAKRKWSKSDEEKVRDALLIRSFLDSTKTQLTYHGLTLLFHHIPPGGLAALFRNSHLSVLYRRPETIIQTPGVETTTTPSSQPTTAGVGPQLFTLATDSAFLDIPDLVWESLEDVDGSATEYYDGELENLTIRARREEREIRKIRERERERGGGEGGNGMGSGGVGGQGGGQGQYVVRGEEALENELRQRERRNREEASAVAKAAGGDPDLELAYRLQQEEYEREDSYRQALQTQAQERAIQESQAHEEARNRDRETRLLEIARAERAAANEKEGRGGVFLPGRKEKRISMGGKGAGKGGGEKDKEKCLVQ